MLSSLNFVVSHSPTISFAVGSKTLGVQTTNSSGGWHAWNCFDWHPGLDGSPHRLPRCVGCIVRPSDITNYTLTYDDDTVDAAK